MKSPLEALRTLLILGRVSNLPTVWSNLLAGWFLANKDVAPVALALLLIGGSFLYVGGMYLNDYCDADFDARYCPERPIPARKISRSMVGVLAVLWFAIGLACLVPFGWITIVITLLLIAAIVLYDFHHKNVSWAPLVMGVCRSLLYALAVSAAAFLIVLWYVIPVAAVLGLYVAGITYLARGESRPEKPTRWALLLLVLPILVSLAFCVIAWPFQYENALFFCLLLLGWMAWLLVPLWRQTNRSIGRVVSGLLAGIVLVDCIAILPVPGVHAGWFLIFFILALLLQRIIPAT